MYEFVRIGVITVHPWQAQILAECDLADGISCQLCILHPSRSPAEYLVAGASLTDSCT